MRSLRLFSVTMLALGAAATAAASPSAPHKTQTLPRPRGGLIYPTLPGGVNYGDRISRLNQAWGTPRAGFWRRGSDVVSPASFLQSNRAWPRELYALTIQTKQSPRGIASSRLRGWRTPEGIHIGSTMAAVRAAYGDRVKCDRTLDHRYCGGLTRPFSVVANGHPHRQIFGQSFHMTLSRPTVSWITAALEVDEGRCDLWIAIRSWNDKNGIGVTAECWGPLESASVSFVDPTSVDPQSPGGGQSERVFDSSGSLVEYFSFNGISYAPASNGVAWQTTCDWRFNVCPPGRGDGGDPAWPAGSIEEWRLSALMSINRPVRDPGSVVPVPAFRFTASFLGSPSYSVLVNRTTTS